MMHSLLPQSMKAVWIMLEQRPNADEQSEYHATLCGLVPDGNILRTLSDQVHSIDEFLKEIPEDQFEVVHEPYGWTVQQVIEHCIDAERVFGYRVLRIASGENIELPGWDENHFADCGYGRNADLDLLASEFLAQRGANLALLARLGDDAWHRQGVADQNPFSVRTLAWLMAGHWIHHRNILEKRLGQSV